MSNGQLQRWQFLHSIGKWCDKKKFYFYLFIFFVKLKNRREKRTNKRYGGRWAKNGRAQYSFNGMIACAGKAEDNHSNILLYVNDGYELCKSNWTKNNDVSSYFLSNVYRAYIDVIMRTCITLYTIQIPPKNNWRKIHIIAFVFTFN